MAGKTAPRKAGIERNRLKIRRREMISNPGSPFYPPVLIKIVILARRSRAFPTHPNLGQSVQFDMAVAKHKVAVFETAIQRVTATGF